MKRIKYLLTAAITVVALSNIPAPAQQPVTGAETPQFISYQGLLTTATGQPIVNGNHNLVITLYSDPEGNTILWQDNITTTVINGIFNVYLGSGNRPLPSSPAMDRPLWIGVSVNGTDEMTPLVPLSASPYALNVPDGAVTTAKIADRAITSEKMDMDYISSVFVDGKAIGRKGAVLNLQSTEDFAFRYDQATGTVTVERIDQRNRNNNETEKEGSSKQAGVLDAWAAGGDAVVIPNPVAATITAGNFMGTTGASPYTDVDFRTNNVQVMKYQASGASTPNIIGGNTANLIDGALIGSVIAGGGNAGSPNQILGTGNGYNMIGGGISNLIDTASDYSFIGGGDNNTIDEADYASIVGGINNSIDPTADHGFIGGGRGSVVSGEYAVIGGGAFHTASGFRSTIAGGSSNTASNLYSAVGGGLDNVASGSISAISGGGFNTASAEGTFIGGGSTNQAAGSYGTIGGGQRHYLTGLHATIGGGDTNVILDDRATIGGGTFNRIESGGDRATIGGGSNNTASNYHSTIAGGLDNLSSGYISTIGGGLLNVASDGYTFVGGGLRNEARAGVSTIGGGDTNVIDVSGLFSFIGGGSFNEITQEHSVIGGGYLNENNGDTSVIAGGSFNRVFTGTHGNFIGGGSENLIRPNAIYSSVLGGTQNFILPNASFAMIGGGDENVILHGAYLSVIGGGSDNQISSGGLAASIPGGSSLTAQSWVQHVIGTSNVPKGAVPWAYGGGVPDDFDSPIFIIGNGIDALNRSNAFEVSYSGHSTVFDQNGTGTVKGAKRGGTYTDNVIYAWGDVVIDDMTFQPSITCDFGTATIIRNGPGYYTITINVIDPDGNPISLDCGSVTATLTNGFPPGTGIDHWGDNACANIKVSQILSNTFDVFVMRPVDLDPDPGLDCERIDSPFTFKVTGRPPVE